MLPRSQRLSVEQFNIVMEKGKVFHSPLFIMRLFKAGDSNRVAAVAPQKVAKKAVERNRMRRKMYEALAPILSTVRIENAANKLNFYAIVLAKSAAINAEFNEIVTDLRAIFVKAGLLK